MNGRWHTDRHSGEAVLLPNGTVVRVMIRGRRVRIEYIDLEREPDAAQALGARGAQQTRAIPPATSREGRTP